MAKVSEMYDVTWEGNGAASLLGLGPGPGPDRPAPGRRVGRRCPPLRGAPGVPLRGGPDAGRRLCPGAGRWPYPGGAGGGRLAAAGLPGLRASGRHKRGGVVREAGLAAVLAPSAGGGAHPALPPACDRPESSGGPCVSRCAAGTPSRLVPSRRDLPAGTDPAAPRLGRGCPRPSKYQHSAFK